jgi:hypothetical protein
MTWVTATAVALDHDRSIRCKGSKGLDVAPPLGPHCQHPAKGLAPGKQPHRIQRSKLMANDVYITVTNETDEFQNIVVFQQQDALNQMFDKLFPIAWKVFP